MSRLRRLVLSDRYIFVTCHLLRGKRHLTENDFSFLAGAFEAARERHPFLLTAWVFLPDHWHAVFFPKFPLAISKLMEVIKVRSTQKINLDHERSGSLWQGRFFDHILWTVEKYHDCLDYIHRNPVRRGWR